MRISEIKMREPYPTRQGNTPAAYRKFILDVMLWKQQKYGDPKWDGGTVGDDLSKSGIRVAQQMEQEGIVHVSLTDDRITITRGGPRTGRPYSPSDESTQKFTITPGPNFPS